MPDTENRETSQVASVPTGNPQWGTEIPPEYDLTEPPAIK